MGPVSWARTSEPRRYRRPGRRTGHPAEADRPGRHRGDDPEPGGEPRTLRRLDLRQSRRLHRRCGRRVGPLRSAGPREPGVVAAGQLVPAHPRGPTPGAVLNLATVLRLLRSPESLSALGPERLTAQIDVLLESFSWEWGLGLVVCGVQLVLVGHLVYRCGYIPRLLGVGLVVAPLIRRRASARADQVPRGGMPPRRPRESARSTPGRFVQRSSNSVRASAALRVAAVLVSAWAVA